jgi:hypothetical protein
MVIQIVDEARIRTQDGTTTTTQDNIPAQTLNDAATKA